MVAASRLDQHEEHCALVGRTLPCGHQVVHVAEHHRIGDELGVVEHPAFPPIVPTSEGWLPPSKSTVNILRATAGRSKGGGVVFTLVAAAFRCDASTLVSTTDYYALSTAYITAANVFLTPGAYSRLS